MAPESGRSSGVEHNLAKVGVEGSNPFARSSRHSGGITFHSVDVMPTRGVFRERGVSQIAPFPPFSRRVWYLIICSNRISARGSAIPMDRQEFGP